MAFPQFEITLFKPSYFLTKASPYLFLIISAIDFTLGNQILSDIITNRYGEAFVKKNEGLKSVMSNCGNAT